MDRGTECAARGSAELLRQVEQLRTQVRALEHEHLELDDRYQVLETQHDRLQVQLPGLRAEDSRLTGLLASFRFRSAERLYRLAGLVPGMLPLLRAACRVRERTSACKHSG